MNEEIFPKTLVEDSERLFLKDADAPFRLHQQEQEYPLV
jgi:hypothetical protein